MTDGPHRNDSSAPPMKARVMNAPDGSPANGPLDLPIASVLVLADPPEAGPRLRIHSELGTVCGGWE